VGLCKGKVFVPPLPLDIDELKLSFDEQDYRLDICQVTIESHSEHL
jgi:hypothetical protein